MPSTINTRFYIIRYRHETNITLLKLLKSGFRHCEIYLCDPSKPIIHLNPLSNIMIIDTEENSKIEFLIKDLKKTKDNWTIAFPPERPLYKVAPLLPLTCVEVIKRILGIHKINLLTPYQLFNYLENKLRKNVDTSEL